MTLEDGHQPGGRQPSPGKLRVLQGFVNTLDIARGVDAFTGTGELASWLIAHGLLPDGVLPESDSLGQAKEVREAFRELLLANTGILPDPYASEVIGQTWERARFALVMNARREARLEPQGPGVARAFGELIFTMFESMVRGTWTRLKACQNEGCQWAFYDSSKNHSGKWCAMAACGNRAKVRRYRQRRQRLETRTIEGPSGP